MRSKRPIERIVACLSLALLLRATAGEDPAAAFESFCRQRAEEARAADRAVIRSTDGWLFLSAELRHLGGGPFWGEATQRISAASREDARDPLPVILDTARQLREAGIALLVVPVPPRAVLYADRLWPEAPKDADGRLLRLDRSLTNFYARLRAEGVSVLDLTEELLVARATDEAEGPICCRQDSHWSPRGAALAAREIATWLRTHGIASRPAAATVVRSEPVEIVGDLWQLLDDAALPRERLSLLRVTQSDGSVPTDDPQASILFLADSHGLIFHAGGDMLAEGGGVSDHLAALGLPVDLIARRGSAATAVRIDLARRIRAESQFVATKKAVVWCFAAREFTESAGWRKVPLFLAKPEK